MAIQMDQLRKIEKNIQKQQKKKLINKSKIKIKKVELALHSRMKN